MSDPSSMGLALAQGITSDLSYTAKAAAPMGRAIEQVVRPSNGASFAASSQTVLELAGARSGTYLDGRSLSLKFTVTYTGTLNGSGVTSYVQVNNFANSYIDSLAVYSGGSTLEIINNYSDISNLMMDLSLSPSQKSGLNRIVGAADDGSNDGHLMTFTGGNNAVVKQTRTFVLPLNCFLANCKMIDLSELLQGFRFEITWASESAAARKSDASNATPTMTSSFAITDVQLVHTLVELDAVGRAMVDATKDPVNGTMYFGKTFRYTTQSVNSAGEITIPGNQRLSSIVAAYARCRTITDTKLNTRSSANPNANWYQFRFGSVVMPQVVVNLDQNDGGYAHAARNILSTINSWGSSASGCALLYATGGFNRYFTREGGANTTTGIQDDSSGNGNFAIGVDTELFSNRSDVLLSGVSTLANPFYLTLSIGTAPTAACIVDLWAHCDVIMIVRGGQVIVRQ